MSDQAKVATVLVIEDEFTIRDTLREALECEGYDVLTAENGRDGINKLRAGAIPKLILLDMMMPIMSGREFLDIVRDDSALAQIPVLVVSATADALNTAGAKAFIRKPPDLEVLLTMIAKYVPHG